MEIMTVKPRTIRTETWHDEHVVVKVRMSGFSDCLADPKIILAAIVCNFGQIHNTGGYVVGTLAAAPFLELACQLPDTLEDGYYDLQISIQGQTSVIWPAAHTIDRSVKIIELGPSQMLS